MNQPGVARRKFETISTFMTTPEAQLEQFGISKHFSPIFKLTTIDPHNDFALDYLHNFSLGAIKWLCHFTFKELTMHQNRDVWLQVDLFSFNGFLVRQQGRQVVRFNSSFDGKDFKVLVQYFVFILDAINADEAIIDQWEKLALICELLWRDSFERSSIEDLQDELMNLAKSLRDFHVNFTNVRKVHMIIYYPEQIRRLGPTKLLSVGTQESSNKEIRHYKLDRTNQHNVSRDLANIEADKMTFAYITSGAETDFYGNS